MGTLRGLITLALLVAFLGLVVWLFFIREKSDFEEAARLAMQENDEQEKPDHE